MSPPETHERKSLRLFSIFASFLRLVTRRIAAVELEVPRDREGTFQTALFQRYQRSEKALVLMLMQAERAVQCSTSACGPRIQNLHRPPVKRTWRECARCSVRRVLLPREHCSPLVGTPRDLPSVSTYVFDRSDVDSFAD